ncbi:MAG: hypothetical protein IJ105_05000 [Bacilli bacterium]|nr:hypothetical protein [Bacilli bacterium]
MRININKYILSDNITDELLINNKFSKREYKDGIKKSYEYIFIKQLYDSIYMKINITLVNDEFILNYVVVLDDNYGKLYYPFYNADDFSNINTIIYNYNSEMNKLCDLEIFKRKEKNLIKEM